MYQVQYVLLYRVNKYHTIIVPHVFLGTLRVHMYLIKLASKEDFFILFTVRKFCPWWHFTRRHNKAERVNCSSPPPLALPSSSSCTQHSTALDPCYHTVACVRLRYMPIDGWHDLKAVDACCGASNASAIAYYVRRGWSRHHACMRSLSAFFFYQLDASKVLCIIMSSHALLLCCIIGASQDYILNYSSSSSSFAFACKCMHHRYRYHTPSPFCWRAQKRKTLFSRVRQQ